MRIVLIGYRGAGKSAVCALVAQRLGLRCADMDAMIAARAGLSIPEIVRRHGWPGFRDLETALALELAGQDRIVVDTGGGIVERPENLAALRRGARVFWLRAAAETIVPRITGDSGRPSLTPGRTFTEEVAEVLARRTPLYRASADHVIDTDALTPEEVAARIADIVKT